MIERVSPLRGVAHVWGLIPWLTPWAKDLSPLRGSRFDRRGLISFLQFVAKATTS